MKHPKYDLIVAAAAGEEMESRHVDQTWHPIGQDDALRMLVACSYVLRVKPKTIVIGGVEVPEPMRVAPERGTVCWVSDLAALNAYSFPWANTGEHQRLLKKALLHATETGAEEHREALIRVSGGGS